MRDHRMEVTVEITQYCEENCDYCSSMASPEGKHRTFEEIRAFLDSVENITRINISGGEPLANPEFYPILQYCYKLTNNVWVYTNAIRQLRYNADVIQEVKVEANVVVVPGRHIYIPKDHPVRLLKLVRQGRARDFPDVKVYASNGFYRDQTHDCSKCENILYQADGQIVEAPCKKKYDRQYGGQEDAD